ncbi:MAG: class 1 fructose-bisphosphatase [Bacteroidetes bacterium]|jgi:fructose-1,6-bisphosphatase I|nr:class 1 fructose-bisphosphatase [Bacteroidota bacterium]MBK7039709.1 class 1 fructose-bisphosphatase [Bacteroidota bacterium]MBK7587505.1 class 1 fructose-bisphosphatase [Bacteroidota bacterium]MBK8329738.1 class 1 fructose-bisphosphatase [Bacteroidota bacterium]MBK9301713.1 class 1 fructose-bisphosphatase [Bacteroidota bacterium]
MNPNRHLMTLDEFTIHQTRQFKHATGELSTLLRDIGLACKFINKQVNKAGLVDILGAHGAVNVQGEEQMKLDIFANEVLINVLRNSSDCAGIASEENDSYVAFEDEHSINSKYVVMFDPLDGSSNIDVNASIGTIFCIYKRVSPLGKPCNETDFLQKGKNIMAAGYVIYGSSTMMVYATRLGVNGFTLEPSVGEFCLSHKDMKCPEDGKIYSINQGNSSKYDAKLIQFLQYCMEDDKETSRPYSHRYIGSMVADLHRTLIKGGLFMYPADTKSVKGKLRLLYECNPMSYIIEMAGGIGTDGQNAILDIEPCELHQRVPIFIGSKKMVEKALDFLK